ncbi:MAG TPA: hypothetical protein VEL31_27785 [Ktedonobacteraceae bacterium]|nr:hypothetical protein [Ktedonobacteraceae bacterium]
MQTGIIDEANFTQCGVGLVGPILSTREREPHILLSPPQGDDIGTGERSGGPRPPFFPPVA